MTPITRTGTGTPPHSIELERHVLGLLILFPAHIPEVSPPLFYDTTNRRICEHLRVLYDTIPVADINLAILCEKIRDSKSSVEASVVSALLDGVQKSGEKDLDSIIKRLKDLEARRNISHLASHLATHIQNLSADEIQDTLTKLKEVKFDGDALRSKTLADELKSWVENSTGEFTLAEIHKTLNLNTRAERKHASTILARLIDSKKIQRTGKMHGHYRRIEDDYAPLNWKDAGMEPYPILYPLDVQDLALTFPRNIVIVAGSKDVGKGHPHGTPILTPDGWKNIEILKEGDLIAAVDGSWTKIKYIFHRGPQQIFRIEFNDKTWIECDYEHLWTIHVVCGRAKKQSWKTLPTYALMAWPYFKKLKLQIPLPHPIQFAQKSVPLSPYVVGVLLGDGCLNKDTVYLTTADEYIINRIRKEHEIGSIGKHNKDNRCPSYPILKTRPVLKEIGIANKRSWEKFIPKDYLFNNKENRIELLRGLMDTDGTVSKSGKTVSYSTTSKQLAEDIAFLVRSLGEKVSFFKPRRTYYRLRGEKRRGRVVYGVYMKIINFNPFHLPRKAERVRTYFNHNRKVITKIVPIGIKKSICLSIDHPYGLYVAKDFIVTHNTGFLLNLAARNMDMNEIHYFSSEMGETELKLRLSLFGHLKPEDWKCHFWERSDKFDDVIVPDALNIIDYLQVEDEFYVVGAMIRKIFDKLKTGVAVIGLQKDPESVMGRGKWFSAEKARIYVSLDHHRLSIVCGKNRTCPTVNPVGMSREFKLLHGWDFIPQTGWVYEPARGQYQRVDSKQVKSGFKF